MINLKDTLKRSVSQIPSAAALSVKDRAALVKALETLVTQHSDKLETPELKKRIQGLKKIQGQYKKLEAKFFKERAALKVKQKRRREEEEKLSTLKKNELLVEEIFESYYIDGSDELLRTFLRERAGLEAKYQELYKPLYKKRYEIINGTAEVQKTENEVEKGVPYFWLTAMKNEQVLLQKITKYDEGALKYLKDIKWCWIGNSKGFKLEFFFDPNPYFKNAVLAKAYHMTCYSPHTLEKTTGTNINWLPGKCLTPDIRKKPRKRSKNAGFMSKNHHRQSFFTFFSIPKCPEFPCCDSTTYLYYDIFKKLTDQFEAERELDYEVGKIIRDELIPHAVSLFTGEAVEQGTEFEDLDDDDDLYGDKYQHEEDYSDDERFTECVAY